MRALGAATIVALLLSTTAHASGAADGNAGLDALNRGSYDESIRLFTRALGDRSLRTDDREFAYLCRGKAYLAKGERIAGAKDLKEALRLNPTDADALAQLQLALGADRSTPTATSRSASSRDPWGMLSAIAGKYYWYQIPGRDPHVAYQYVSWISQGQTLSVVIRNKHGVVAVGEVKLDPATNKLIDAAIVPSGAVYGTETAGPQSETEYSYSQGQAGRTTARLQPDGSVTQVSEKFDNGAWKETARVTLVEVSKDTLQSEGFIKKR